jgi:hypothetical protein
MKEASRSGHRYKAWGCRIPSMGQRVCQLLAILCVFLSIALVALGGSDPIGGFCLWTLSFGRPHDNRGAHFEYGCHVPRCIGHITWGVGWCLGVVWCVKLFLLRLWSPAALPPQLLHRGAIKLACSILLHRHLPAWPPTVSPPPSLWLKRMRK